MQVQLVCTRTLIPKPYDEIDEEDPFEQTYNDCIDKEFQLVYAFGGSDIWYQLTLGLCITAPTAFALVMISFYYMTYKELEYTTQSLSEMLENVKEIYMNLPPSSQWIFAQCFIIVCATCMHYFINKNNICRIYYSSRKDQYIGIVYQYGQKKKLKFTQRDISRKPVFLERFFQKKGITLGTEETFYIYERNFRDMTSQNQFFSEVAASEYLDKLKGKNRYRFKSKK